jgi:hypothetical protein
MRGGDKGEARHDHLASVIPHDSSKSEFEPDGRIAYSEHMPYAEQFLQPSLELLQDHAIIREPTPIQRLFCELKEASLVPDIRSPDMQRLGKGGLTAQ